LSPELLPQPPLLALPAAVKSVGFMVADYGAVIRQLAGLVIEGVPERAVDKRRAEFLAGRFAALSALRALGVNEPLGRNEDGSPRWPAAVVGSITHGASRALCAVARSTELRGVGIDAERLMTVETKVELRRRICTAAELAVGDPLRLVEHELVSLAFSAKESLYKCLYPMVGRFMDLHAATIVAGVASHTAEGQVAGELTLELAVDWSGAFRAGQRFTAVFHKSAEHVETAVVLRA
jgi:enterobactin synthetase component D